MKIAAITIYHHILITAFSEGDGSFKTQCLKCDKHHVVINNIEYLCMKLLRFLHDVE